MREVWRHDIQAELADYAETLRQSDTAIFINGVGEIGLSLLKLSLNSGIPIAGMFEPHPKATTQNVAVRLGLGRSAQVEFDEHDDTITVGGQTIRLYHELDAEHRFDEMSEHRRIIVMDCSGVDFSRAGAERMLKGGADAVFFSGPGATAEERSNIPLLLHGITLDELSADMKIGSMGSCTTNSVVAPIIALHETFGVQGGMMISVHSATNSDTACDTWSSRGILDAIGKPGGSGALKLVGLLIEDLAGAFAGGAIRIPAADGSMTYLDLFLDDDSLTVDKVNDVLEAVAAKSLFFGCNHSPDPLTVSDIRETYYLAWMDPRQTRVVPIAGKGSLVQIASGYSNKWGYAAALLALPARWAELQGA